MEQKTRKRAVRLNTASDIQKLLARVINQVLRGEISPKDAAKIGDLCKIQLKAIEQREAEIANKNKLDMDFLNSYK